MTVKCGEGGAEEEHLQVMAPTATKNANDPQNFPYLPLFPMFHCHITLHFSHK